MSDQTSCPCNSGRLFKNCCQPMLTGEENAKTAKALMRSRYTGFVMKNVEYLLKTWHQSARPTDIDPVTIPQWCNLRIESTNKGEEFDSTGVVEFKATFLSHTGPQVLHEMSTFVKEEGLWYYLDGQIINSDSTAPAPGKIGRNEPCPCGSGKKFKKCCSP